MKRDEASGQRAGIASGVMETTAHVSESGVGHATALALHRRDRAMLGVVLLLVFGFSCSADLVAWVLEVIGVDTAVAWGIGLVGSDVVTLLVVGLLKRVIGRTEGGESRLWQTWWLSLGVLTAASLNADPLTLFSAARRAALPADWVRVRDAGVATARQHPGHRRGLNWAAGGV
jgi:hypothetical protein